MWSFLTSYVVRGQKTPVLASLNNVVLMLVSALIVLCREQRSIRYPASLSELSDITIGAEAQLEGRRAECSALVSDKCAAVHLVQGLAVE